MNSKVSLKSITSKIGSGATPRGGKESYKNQGISLIRSMNIYDFSFEYKDLAFIDSKQANELANVEVEPEDILLNITGASVARCALVPNCVLPARVNQHVSIIRIDKSKAVPKYALYVINSPYYKKTLLSIAQGGATREALTKEKIENFEIPSPPLPIQQRIASILSAYDGLIENNSRRIKILEEMAQRIYKQWFVDFKFPGHEKAKFIDSPLGKIPNGWEVKNIEHVIEFNPKETLSKESKKTYAAMENLSNDSMVTTFKEYRSGNSGSKYRNGDTLFARITPCLENGKTGFVHFLKNDEVGIGSTEFIVLRSKMLCPEYVYLLARSDDFRDLAIKSMAGASGRQRVRLECFSEYQIAKPAAEVINIFSKSIRPAFAQIFTLDKQNNNLRQTRDLLLPKLINGEIGV